MNHLKKLIAVLSIVLFSTAFAYAQEISVDYKNVKLSTVFEDIRSKSGYNFIYNNSLVDVNALVTVSAKGSVPTVLDLVLKNLAIDYKIVDNQIILSPSEKTKKDEAVKIKTVVSGLITDDDNLPVAGVFVQEKGTQNAVMSDLDGKYSISATPGSVILFSCLGFKEIEKNVPSTNSKIDVRMASDINYLDEVVVVGYGTQKRANLTGAVSTINFSEGLDSRPITSTSTALGGLAPGLAVTQTSGKPGSDGASLRIRGNTTLNTNSPLVLVDGVEYSMDNVNPQDIESITVLKDASSTAIYGSRAANGVILVTTKLGKSGKTNVTYNCNMSMQLPDIGGLAYVTDYAESMRLVNEGCDNLGLPHAYSDQTIELWEYAKLHPNEFNAYGVENRIAYPNTDWFAELFQPGLLQKHNVSVSGGNEKVRSYISIGYLDNQGVMSHHGLDSSTQKVDLRTNVEVNITDWLSGGMRFFGERQDYGMANTASGFQYLKITVPGIYPGSKNKWGYIATDEENQNANNIFKNMADRDGKDYNYRASATAYLKAKILESLNFEVNLNHNTNFGYVHEYSVSNNTWNYVTNTLQADTPLTTAYNKISISNSYRTNGEAILRYGDTFGKHEVAALGGFSASHHIAPFHSVSKQGKSDWGITEMSAYTTLLGSDSGNSDWGLLSGFGRINYAYDSKYLFEANLRYDGSSRFSPESRWGLFPSFSAGWRIGEEKWMQSTKSWLDELKLRASWGVAGNNNSGNYAWQSTFSSVNVVSGGAETPGLIVTALGNRNLEWETTKTADIGLDFAFLNSRLTGEIDGYVRNTTGILFRPSIYMTMGDVASPYENLASVQNKGLELGIKWRDGIGNDFSYSIGLNLAYNITTVLKYKGKLIKEWTTDEDGNKIYINNMADVAQSGFGGYILDGHILGDQYLYQLYRGTGKGYSGEGEVDINAGPVDGMIRTEEDMQWVIAMITSGYTFRGGQPISKNTFYYGDFIYADLDGDGDYGDDDDRKFTGHSNTPKYTMGLNLGCRWKSFDFSALLTGAFDFYLNWNTSVYNTSLVNLAQSISRRIADDHYFYNTTGDPTENNINGTYPRLTFNKSFNDELSDFYHYRGDYVKLKSIQLGYSLPKEFAEKIKTDALRIFISGENLFTITGYPGLDPEIGTSVGYPLMRTICGGIQLTF